MKNKRKICVVTDTRAEYGLLYWLMKETLKDNITVKRPANGINPMRWDEVIGTIANKDYEEDELL
jgi:hypothetical protein